MITGRPRKTVLQKQVEGNRGKRALHPELELSPERIYDAPRPPASLGKAGKALWSRIFSDARSGGECWLTKADLLLVESACSEEDLRALAQKSLDEQGLIQVIATKGGGQYEQQRPEVSIATQAKKRRDDLLSQLGFSPSCRAKLAGAIPARAESPLALAMGRPSKAETECSWQQ